MQTAVLIKEDAYLLSDVGKLLLCRCGNQETPTRRQFGSGWGHRVRISWEDILHHWPLDHWDCGQINNQILTLNLYWLGIKVSFTLLSVFTSLVSITCGQTVGCVMYHETSLDKIPSPLYLCCDEACSAVCQQLWAPWRPVCPARCSPHSHSLTCATAR